MRQTDLIKRESKIQSLIARTYIDPTGNSKLIQDGIVNIPEYIEAPKKILWILKEAYCGGEELTGGGWSLRGCLDEKTDEWSRYTTFQPICYVSYGVLENKDNWDDMPWLKDSEAIRMCLRKVAFMNISKLPGYKTTANGRIHRAYEHYKDVILKQIEAYEPDIIFSCGPHDRMIADDLGCKGKEWVNFRSADALRLPTGQVLVSVHHPNQRKTKRLDYVNDAIRASKLV